MKSLFDLCTQVLIDNIDGKSFSQIGLYHSPFIPFFLCKGYGLTASAVSNDLKFVDNQ